MKQLLLLLLVSMGAGAVQAQKDTSDNYVKRFVSIPAINVHTVPDSSAFSNKDIKGFTPFVLMFFNPDCDNCQKETKELLAHKDELKGVQVLMVSSSSFGVINDFYKEYKLSSMPNLKVAQDLNSGLGSVYKLNTFPSTFVYDKRGILAKAFVGNIAMKAIIDAVK